MCAALRLAGLVSAVGVAHRHPPLRRHGLRRHQDLRREQHGRQVGLYCTVLYCTVLYCRWDCDYYGKTDPGGKYMQLFSFAWQSMFNVRFEEAVLAKLLKKWRLL